MSPTELELRYAALPSDDLVRILTKGFHEYTPEALEIACKELATRGITGIVEPMREEVDSQITGKALGEKWLNFWTYFYLPVTAILIIPVVFWRYKPIGILLILLVVAYGLHHRRLWAWQWNWVIILSFGVGVFILTYSVAGKEHGAQVATSTMMCLFYLITWI